MNANTIYFPSSLVVSTNECAVIAGSMIFHHYIHAAYSVIYFPPGYTECKHFLVDASSGKYHFVGPKQQKFKTLPELFRFYR